MGISQLKNPDVVSAANTALAQTYDSVKIPVSLEVPDRVMTNLQRDSSGYGFVFLNDDYQFLNQTVDNDAILSYWDTQRLGQKFTTGAKGNRLKKVTLTLNRPGSSGGSTYVAIYSDLGGVPGSLLGTSAAFLNSSITQGVKQGYTFTFASEVVLQPNTNYWIVVYSTGTSTYQMQWYCRISGADTAKPASVYNGSTWTNDSTRNMTYQLIGYYTDGTIEVPVTLKEGVEYKTAYILADVGVNTTITIDLINRNTNAVLYANLTNGQAITLDPSVISNLKIRATLSRSPGEVLTLPKLNAIGFYGKVSASRNRWVDREFKTTPFSDVELGSNIGISSGGLTLESANPGVSVKTMRSGLSGYTTTNNYTFGSTAGCMIAQPLYTQIPYVMTGFSIYANVYVANTVVDFLLWADDNGKPGEIIASVLNQTLATTGWQKITAAFSSALTIRGTYWVGLRLVSSNYIYLSYNASVVDSMNCLTATPTGGWSDPSGYNSVYFETYGYTTPNQAVVTLSLPGVENHGLIYPLAYLPNGSSVTMEIADPVTKTILMTLNGDEKASLALIDAQLLNRVRLILNMTPSSDGKFPIIGFAYHYDGAEMSPVINNAQSLKYSIGHVGAGVESLRITGKGTLQYLSVRVSSNATTSATSWDEMSVELDGIELGSISASTAGTSGTLEYLKPNGYFDTSMPSGHLDFEFKESLVVRNKNTTAYANTTLAIVKLGG
jgi:hypothetical protein